MPSPWSIIESALAEQLVGPDGSPARARLILPGTAPNDEHFQGHRPDPMHPEYAEILSHCSGLRLGGTELLFTDYHFQAFDCLLPDWLELLGDGAGNFWVLEVTRHALAPWGPVWFVCQDPPVMVLVSRGLPEFLEMVIDAHRPKPRLKSNPYLDSMNAALAVWNSDLRGAPAASCRASPDKLLAGFAQQLPKNAIVMDFRAAEPGAGLAWDQLDWSQEVVCATDPLLRAGFVEAD